MKNNVFIALSRQELNKLLVSATQKLVLWNMAKHTNNRRERRICFIERKAGIYKSLIKQLKEAKIKKEIFEFDIWYKKEAYRKIDNLAKQGII